MYVVRVLATRKEEYDALMHIALFPSCLEIVNVRFTVLHFDALKRKYRIIVVH